MDKAIAELVQFVKEVSPMLWATAEAKVRTEIQLASMWTIFFGVVTVLLFVAIAIFARAIADCPTDFAFIFFVSMLINSLPVVGFCVNLEKYILYTRATDWHIIKALAELSPLG